jgi:hypothetical protein
MFIQPEECHEEAESELDLLSKIWDVAWLDMTALVRKLPLKNAYDTM